MSREEIIAKHLENQNGWVVKKVRIYGSLSDINDIDYIQFHVTFKDFDNIEKLEEMSIAKIDLQKANRDIQIDELFKEETIEDIIYTDDQLERLNQLRRDREYQNKLTTKQQLKLEEKDLLT